MNEKIIDGKKIAHDLKEELKAEIETLKKGGITPGLAVIIVGADPASQVYVRNKKRAAEELGIYSQVFEMPEDTKEEELLEKIEKLNHDEKIHGILVQLPLPKHINEEKIILAISPQKDVDCFHPENFGKVILGPSRASIIKSKHSAAEKTVIFPCTPAGIIELLKRTGIEISGKNVVVVGRSNIVGKPTAMMLMEENATVSVCHSKTKDLTFYTKNADIIISAAGKPNLITVDMIKAGAVIIDVGINRLPDGRLVGDVDFDGVIEKVLAITPVPGGVGPMTIACLMKNTVASAKTFIE